MPEITIDIEVWCSCGEGLCNQSDAHHNRQGIVVEPCDTCLEAQYDEGRNCGYDEGYTAGEADAN
jgi:hypothetical protein